MVDNKNSRANRKRKPTTTQRRGNPAWVPGMESPNPVGAPRRGQSWAEVINKVGDLTGPEAAGVASSIASQLRGLGDGVTLKEAVVVRAYADLLFDPKAGMLVALMDRAEGKPDQTMTVNWRELALKRGLDPELFKRAIAATLQKLLNASDTPTDPHDDGE